MKNLFVLLFIFLFTLASIFFIYLYHGNLDLKSAVNFDYSLVIAFLINLMAGCLISFVSFNEGRRAEKGETENVQKIIENIDSGSDIILLKAATDGLNRFPKKDQEEILRSIQELKDVPGDQMSKNSKIRMIRSTDGNYYSMRVDIYRATFIRTREKFIVTNIFRGLGLGLS